MFTVYFRMRRFLMIPLLFAVVASSAQNTKKGFKLLAKGEYDKSAEIFKDALAEKKEDPAASFGLSMIYGDDKSTLFNLVESWDLARTCQSNIANLDPDAIEFIGDYFHDTEARPRNIPVRKKMEYALETIEAKLIKYVREENNLGLVYEVLERFPDFRYHDNVMHIRNQLEFRKYEKQNTLEGYLEFISRFPDAAQIDKAIRYRNQLAYEKAEQYNTPEAYREFMKAYPQAQECNLAIKKLNAAAYQKARQQNNIQAMEEFMAGYPDALEVADAKMVLKQLLYEYAKKIRSLDAYNEFIRKYPEGQQYVDIFNLRSTDKGARAVQNLQTGHMLWARSFGNDGGTQVSATATCDSAGSYITGGTIYKNDTARSDIWLIKTSGDGQMLWNKTVGEEYNDELKMLELTLHDQIIGVGYTWQGLDTASRESWMFKMERDGHVAWSKKLGSLEINSLLSQNTGNIVLAGYEKVDTTGEHYALLSLNANGKNMWDRSYSGNGRIMKIMQLNDKNMLIAGDHWRAKIDPHGYLIWDASFPAGDSILTAIQLSTGEIIYLGSRSHAQAVILKTSAENKTVFEKEFAAADPVFSVRSLIPGNPGELIALMDFPSFQEIYWISSSQGEIIKSYHIPGDLMITRLQKDFKGNLILSGFNGEIILVKNQGTDL